MATVRKRLAAKHGERWRKVAGSIMAATRYEGTESPEARAALDRYGDVAVQAAAVELADGRAEHAGGRPTVERTCELCGFTGTASEVLAHECTGERERLRAPGAGRPKVLRICEFCGAMVSGREARLHRGGRCKAGK